MTIFFSPRLHLAEYANETLGADGELLARFEHSYLEDDWQVESVERTGRLFATYGDQERLETTFSYNDQRELTGSSSVTFDDQSTPHTLNARNFSMNYDDAGNRTTDYVVHSDSQSGTASDRYTERTNPLTAYLTGQAPLTVAADWREDAAEPWKTVSRLADGSYFEHDFAAGNGSGNVSGTAWLRVGDLEREKPYHVREQTEAFAHDDAGNRTADAAFAYHYDAEERLVAVDFPNGWRKQWTYDYLSRRAREELFDDQQTLLYSRLYIYDDWRVIAEVDPDETASDGIIKTFIWGMDVANTLGAGTGNIGALLAIDNWQSGEQYQVGYDAMGNVSLLVDADTGTMTAGMEYSPFGELVRTTGNWRETPFLYSTKWHLDYGPEAGETWPLNLYDYGLRVYDPGTGRFITKDPIGDAGGSNLYAFTGNDPVNRVDFMGLSTFGPYDMDPYEVRPPWDDEISVSIIYTVDGLYIDEPPQYIPEPIRMLEPPLRHDSLSYDGSGRRDRRQEVSGAQGQQWTPNEEDCNELGLKWGKHLGAKPGDPFDSVDDAAIAALFYSIPFQARDRVEYRGAVYHERKYRWFGNRTYSFTLPQPGEETRGPGTPSLSGNQYREGDFHTHPTHPIGRFGNRPGQYDEFSTADKYVGWRLQVPVFIGNDTGTMKRFDVQLPYMGSGSSHRIRFHRDRTLDTERTNIDGHERNIGPNQDYGRILACQEAGML